MGEGKKAVQRRVDGGGHGIVAEGAQRIHGHHFVFSFGAFITALQREQLVLVKGGEAGAANAAQIAARALDP